mmetsp:Transcript_152613/g.489385  ORF Transcript_152613/g.489385 Transcript_152613/m.489385 type:complete len:273 (+) Transcript_152613:235-1053(+)
MVPSGCTPACSPTSSWSSPVSPSGHVFKVRMFPRKPHPLQLLGTSKSSPTLLLGYDPGQHPPRVWSEEEKHWRKVALSPQGLFARTCPSEMEWGSTVGHRFHELGMQDARVRVPAKKSSGSPQGSSPPDTPKQPDSPPMSPSRTRGTEAAVSPEMMSLNASAREAGWKDMQDRKDMFDIRQGFRVAIFGVPPLPLSAEKVWPPPRKDRAPATREQTMKVYEAFLKMLEMDKKAMYREDESEQERMGSKDSTGSYKNTTSEQPRARHLPVGRF